MNDKKIKEHEKGLVREELKIKLLKTLAHFDSKEVNGYKITDEDIVYVLSSMISRRFE
jgi:hypothetical protein